jgi:hypothetical protein
MTQTGGDACAGGPGPFRRGRDRVRVLDRPTGVVWRIWDRACSSKPIGRGVAGEQAWPGVNRSDSAVTSAKSTDYHMLPPSPHDPALARSDHGSAVNAHKPHRLGGALARGDSQASWSLIAVGNQRSANGFDWGDASIGAGLALALVLLGGGAAVLASRHSNRVQAA